MDENTATDAAIATNVIPGVDAGFDPRSDVSTVVV